MNAAQILGHLLRTGQAPGWYAPADLTGPEGQAVIRLIAAMRAGAQGIDWAVLVRQCLRALGADQSVSLAPLGAQERALFEGVAVHQRLDGTLVAEPYCPDWVADLGNQAVDRPQSLRPLQADSGLPGEPWLEARLGLSRWKSQAQREAAWRALKAPENSTLLIGLPTGSGKSLVYQCCTAFEPGLTVLVVPTVALGIDQLAAVRALPCAQDWSPMLFTPGEQAQAVLDAVRERRCRLLITSPEAIVSGRLSQPLRQHAQDGFLRRLVIDEAHLIESWGAEFRIEFQLLGAVLRAWRSIAPSGIRALLLSATFAPSTPAMLQEMFAGEGTVWEQHIVQRLRPEIHYFAAAHWSQQEQQVERVLEALHRLPRPAIIYVTEVAQAQAWSPRLKAAGFARWRVFHGNTPDAERRAIMHAWRADQLDLVVATSAFGMGVDKPDVRAVVHACFPEGIDRFYQEVGRGGRDGQPCTSLWVPTLRDQRVAATMGPTLLKDADKISGRWRAMWNSRQVVDETETSLATHFRLRTDVQPAYRFGRQSYGENRQWNKRLLLMMDRAGLLRIEGLSSEPAGDDREPIEWASIRPRVATLQLECGLAAMLEAPREQEMRSIRRAGDALLRCFHTESIAMCREVKSHYGAQTVRACGSCRSCRVQQEHPAATVTLKLEEETQRTSPRVHVVQAPALNSTAGRAEVIQALRQVLQAYRFDRFVVAPSLVPRLRSLLEIADDQGKRAIRIDELGSEPMPIVAPSEAILILHMDSIDEGAAAYHYGGRWVTHWLLGGEIENVPGRWPFMHESAARPYLGRQGLTQWLHDARHFTSDARLASF